MLKNTMKILAVAMAATTLVAAFSPAQASGQLPIFKACLAKAEKAPDPEAARNQCTWEHWNLMAEYGP